MMRPYIHVSGPKHKIMWVVECSAGKNAQNSLPTDVSYLQWYYTLAAEFSETSQEHKSIYKNVLVTGRCSGLDSDPLVQAILVQQRDFGHPIVDGKASIVHGSGLVDDKAFFVLRLGARFAVMYPQLWPRLDLMPRCPPLVAQASREAIPQRSELH
ncbi:hypothetical protein PQR34_00495 [Paraburkholderia sediminicola]|uniref:hypothetical protein n=1 Tax=Paraburkholderia sediminicola TaxID=458836 RepID=UPI0038B83683